ncbi:DNA mismatch repair endonuclease MutL [Colwellia sp. 4_MG-2023]|uniref:DNA mismatch repair endonuclease MutL n=1 Tax=unclassified Colwellia TaxID=196834 RepID=UPI0026E3E631|nr:MULTISPECIES: DNA mismatch repair endonuclease MutL [unclassified Colwellia]MDO6507412.1 DNA mismatch repair endonuclease MutL [Colwellia sp. 5_MG-2023]MDO6556168.1 DNA mismatch repair endonuclease MutL [Colwellia sp. 4_MG-2023]
MTIAILPARLANQIAAGEVVERPASVIKELVENSLDAGATNINIEVDKGGVKRIRISDNGAGIVKDELTLALSRHATSKIKDLSDLEAINSLGFRGEALASISSVARLTLTSKPKAQATAWQASAEGRDMAVSIQPAAHPDGTTIEVLDLFFNTPARRKFLRTEKTEFNHIDEVIRRIALACFDVSFSLTHNGKIIRQYRAAMTKAQSAKRVAMVCGQKFVEHAVEVHCQHDDMLFSGWLAKPSFARNQNDLCYSYVNGRMMRDKLINHAIRQAYADLLPPDTYPAFVLFLTLDHREVDVNVHPAKHEVRFHQSRYVHDFIYSVCHKALMENNQLLDFQEEHLPVENQVEPIHESVQYDRPDYIKPLAQINEKAYSPRSATTNNYTASPRITKSAVENYQKLMTPIVHNESEPTNKVAEGELSNPITALKVQHHAETFFIAIEQGQYGIFKQDSSLRLLSLATLAYQLHKNKILLHWQLSETKPNKGLISQPLLLPVVIKLSEQQMRAIQHYQSELALAGIVVTVNDKGSKGRLQIRQFPALLREQDVSTSFIKIIEKLLSFDHGDKQPKERDKSIIAALASVMVAQHYSEEQAQALWLEAKKTLSTQKIDAVLLKSVPLDLTSQVKQLISITELDVTH